MATTHHSDSPTAAREILDQLLGPTQPVWKRETRMIAAMTASGSTTLNDDTSGALGNELDAALLQHLRRWSDVVLVGARTVTKENYGPISIPEELAQARQEAGQLPYPRLAIPTRNLSLNPNARIFSNPAQAPFLLVPDQVLRDPATAHKRKLLQEAGAILINSGDGEPPSIINTLHAHGLARITCEGGPGIYGGLLAHNLIDLVHLTIDPHLTVPVAKPLLSPWPDSSPVTHKLALEFSHTSEDSLIFIRYRIQ